MIKGSDKNGVNSNIKRFESKIIRSNNGCWIWQAAKKYDGYGLFYLNRKLKLAHRASYELFIGKFDENLLVLHKCDNPHCVNPDHLSLGDQSENMKQRSESGRTNMDVKINDDHTMIEIKSLVDDGFKASDVAKIFRVSRCSIFKAINDKRWSECL